jgi:hypothetical protein
MKCPADKAVPYLVVVIVCAIVLWIVIGIITATTSAMFLPSLAMRASPSITRDSTGATAQMEAFSRKMEEANRKMEAAQKGGDAGQQMEAAMGALGTVLSGGKAVEPLQLDALKPYAPETFAGLPRTGQSSDRSGVAGLMVAKVDSDYGDGSGKRVRLEVMDTGGAAGLMSIAGWAAAGVGSEREDDSHKERFLREGDRVIHEEVSKRGGSNTYTVVLNRRFVVEAKGTGVDLGALKGGVASLDLAKLESLK